VVSVIGVSFLQVLHTERIIFVLSEPICVKFLHIRLRLESLDDTDDADDSVFVDFVGC